MLKLYIISTVISMFVILVNVQAHSNKLKRKGYIDKNKYSIAEYFQSFIIMVVPILNIIIALYMILNMEKCYETLKGNRVKI